MPRIINTPPASGGAMPPKSPWHSRPTGCEHPAVLLLLFSVAMLMASPDARASTASDQPEKKIAPAERRSRSPEIVEQVQRRERVYREGWPPDEPFAYRGARPYAPPPVYGEDPREIGPAPFVPPWPYRNRSPAW